MKAITDLEKLESFKNKLSKIITSDGYSLYTSYLERMNWLVIPIQEGPFYWYIVEDNYERDYEEEGFGIEVPSFVRTLKKMGYQSCYALVEGGGPDYTFELEINEEEILDFSDEYNIHYYTLFPKDYSFIMLYVSDYSLVAGKKEFVESIIECDIETAMNAFKKDVTTGWVEPNSKSAKEGISVFLNIYEKYKAHNEKILRKLGEA